VGLAVVPVEVFVQPTLPEQRAGLRLQFGRVARPVFQRRGQGRQ